MSGESTDRPDFRLLSDLDVAPWRDYFREMLEDNNLNLSVKCQDLNDEEEGVKECSNCVTVVILLSPSVLATLAKNASRIEPILHAHPCVTVIRISSSSEDFDRNIKPNYQCSSSWHVFDVSVAQEDDNRKMVSEIIDLFDRERTRQIAEQQQPKKPRPSKRTRPATGTPSAMTSIVEMVCPDCIRKADERVVVVFREAVGGTVQVNFRDNCTKLDTKKINPYTYMFKAPAHKAGRTKIYIYIDGEKTGHSWPFRYESPAEMAYQSPAFLCQLMGIEETDLKALDDRLAAMYKDSVPNDYALSHILTPRAMSTTPPAATCDHRFPTLLHFAAFYGLQDLCAAVMETPGAHQAFDVTNDAHQNPYDIAKEQGHEEIAEYMDSFMELQCYVQDYEAMYDIHKGKVFDNEDPPYDAKGYLSMRGRDRVPYVDYSSGGVPAAADGGYIMGGVQANLVSEVKPEEDVCVPALPVRKPRKTVSPDQSQPDRPIPPSSLPPVRESVLDPQSSPYHGDETAETPEDFFAMPIPMSPFAMRSSACDELHQLQELFKEGEFTIDEVERLFHSWTDRNRDPSVSMKERNKNLREIKEKHATLLRNAKTACKKKQGLFSRFTNKKSKEPIYEPKIEHYVGNQYSVSPTRGSSRSNHTIAGGSDRMSTISNTSTTSNTSTISSSSSGSHDSGLSRLDEYSDSEPDEFAPPVPRRDSSTRNSQENRRSLSLQFLESTPRAPSRLPKPPPVPTSHPPQRKSTGPKVPPRKTSFS